MADMLKPYPIHATPQWYLPHLYHSISAPARALLLPYHTLCTGTTALPARPCSGTSPNLASHLLQQGTKTPIPFAAAQHCTCHAP